METPPPLWETSAWSPSQWKTVSWRSEETSCVSVCACYLLCCHWTPWKPGSVFFVLPNSGYFYTSVRASLSFLSFGLSSVSSLDLFSPETSPSASLFPVQPRMLLAAFAARAHCWFMVTSLSTRTQSSLSPKLLSICSAPDWLIWFVSVWKWNPL